jgi:hypothetical protein
MNYFRKSIYLVPLKLLVEDGPTSDLISVRSTHEVIRKEGRGSSSISTRDAPVRSLAVLLLSQPNGLSKKYI